MANSWFKYNDSGSITDPTNYDEISYKGPSIFPKVNIHNIFAKVQFIGEISRPIIRPALQTEINAAYSIKKESANVRLGP